MIQVPLPVLLALAGLLIWISVEDVASLSFPITSVLLLSGVCTAIALWLGVPLWLHCAAAAGYFALFATVDRVLRPSSDTPALGLGDSLLIACGALLLGPIEPIQVILLASVAGLFWVVAARLVLNRPWRAPLPFGLFLSLGIWITFLEPGLIGHL